MENIALVELGGSHDECLLSQFMALKNKGFHLTFVGTKDVWDRNPSWRPFVDQFHEIVFTGKAFPDFRLMLDLNAFFDKNKISKVVLNTAQGAHIRNLCLTSSRKTEFIGIIHTLRKFEGSFTQRLITRKIKKYIVLNDYFLPRIVKPKGVSIVSFYPLRFPHYETEVEKKPDEIWITIIGGVENRRKDLNGSIALMKSMEKENVRFIFLGKSTIESSEFHAFEMEIEQKKLKEKVIFFDHFVPAELFDAYLRKTDLIWPMVHPNTPSADQYLRNQISGAMNVAFGYKIPLLVHQDYIKQWEDFWCAIPYSENDFAKSFQAGKKNIEMIRARLQEHEKFSPEFQEEKYMAFLLK